MVSLAVALYSSASVLFFLLVDADPADFDPRPAVRRVVEAGHMDWLLVAVVDARHSLRETALSAAALLMLLAPSPSESAR
jgi:hypothetical protein